MTKKNWASFTTNHLAVSYVTLCNGLNVDFAYLFKGQFRLPPLDFPDRDVLLMYDAHITQSLRQAVTPVDRLNTSTVRTKRTKNYWQGNMDYNFFINGWDIIDKNLYLVNFGLKQNFSLKRKKNLWLKQKSKNLRLK